MRSMEIMEDAQALAANQPIALACDGVWFVCSPPSTRSLLLELQPAGHGGAGGATRLELPPGYCGLLLFGKGNLLVRGGTLHYHRMHCDVLVKLLAFMDEAHATGTDTHDNYRRGAVPGLHRVPVQASWADRRQCELWFLSQIAAPGEGFRTMLDMLRRCESYDLIRFLLTRAPTGGTLRHMCTKYGVSYSHFRRLCRGALGESAKIALRDWRMARSMLEVAQGNDSFTEIALRNGYASSSHFSTEIKELIGMSPTSAAGALRTLAR
ncbi:helix-turn-helix domain-containing protein [Pandoraea anhela]|uniref:Invasion protein InvF n=1 Tax=Pandoraea anhela TaxID=2508295 RepID=A0A5E4SUG6_9BURK|nr:helix-turn-helix domain-containing protein [Pandoraea anhela]VVD77439.1 Invasion protein InvF [Pandoraea anhela]